jgi:hypothetical protein
MLAQSKKDPYADYVIKQLGAGMFGLKLGGSSSGRGSARDKKKMQALLAVK